MTVTVLIGDVRAKLAEMSDESVHCVVTSPPYWGLRDYGVAGQIGLEPTLGEHLAVMVEIFREVRRVLRSDGTVWLNYGDCYATSPNGRSAADTKAADGDDRTFRDKPFSTIGPIYRAKRDAARWGGGNNSDPTLKPKDLCMVPNRLAIALQDDGWWIRSEIIWAKKNPMPESITDRPASSHEKVWLLSKSARYFYDAEAVREGISGGAHARRKDGERLPAKGTEKNDNRTGTWKESYVPAGRNLRNIWIIATAPFSEAHFATFPPDLAERCILAGTSVRGVCAGCGAPWVRDVEKTGGSTGKGWHDHANDSTRGQHSQNRAAAAGWEGDYKVTTAGWSHACACNADTVPATVLDIFGGAGTTGLVADRVGRDAILIELNPDYAAMARRRIDQDAATRGSGPAEVMRGDDLPLFEEAT